MGKVRVYELAKELQMSNKELVAKLQEMGYQVKSHSSTIEEFEVKDIKDRLAGKKAQVITEQKVRPTVIRRRKKIVPKPEEEAAGEAVEEAEAAETEESAEVAEPVAAASEAPVEAAPEPEPVEEAADTEAAPVEAGVTEAVEAEAEAAESEEVQAAEIEAKAEISDKAEPEVIEAAEEAVEAVDTAEITDEAVEAAPSEAVETETEQKEATAAEAAEEPTEEEPHEEATEEELQIKRIEKTTAEPAKIISRPVVPPERLMPKKPAAPPAAPVKPEPAPKPRPKPGRHLELVPEPEPKAVPAEGKKGKRRKKGKETETETDGRRRGRRREVIERNELYDTGWDRSGRGRKTARAAKKPKKTEITTPKAIKRRIKVDEAITVSDLAKKMGVKSGDIIKQLMTMGVMAHLNQSLDFDTAALVAGEFGYDVELVSFDEEQLLHQVELEEGEKRGRPPVVTVMGHVDHGKTSLLDAIRETNVIGGEAGGITQHIGAYHVKVGDNQVTFLDTPGHEAFTSMRARGAQITDIVVLIVAADDGVMQQTREAADHARAAGVPIIVAVNKVDKPDAEPERIRREVSDLGLVPESWGGDTIFVDISAKQRTGIDELLDLILLQAELLELTAPGDGRAYGHIVEARLDKGRGPVATVLVQGGLLKQGDPFVCGVYHGRIRAMFDDRGGRVDEAGPSIPVEIQGITGVPQAGDEFVVVEDDKQAKQVSQHRQLKQRETELVKTSKLTLENLFDSIKEDAVKELNLVLKADVQGSLEAIIDALHKLGTDEIKINLITRSTGAITESDIMLAAASNALVVGFNVRPNAKVQDLADHENIQIRFYDVIYKLIEEIKDAMAGMLAPIEQEKVLGRAEVREAFRVSKVGMIAGVSVADGKITRGSRARLLRDDVVIYDGKITSLRRFKDDVREVLAGYECGIGLENYDDVKAGDVIEAYIVEEIAATLD
jgi:translation initiation factor IF-2